MHVSCVGHARFRGPLPIDSILILLLLKFKTVARRRQSMSANSTQFAHNLCLKLLTDFRGGREAGGCELDHTEEQRSSAAAQSLMPVSDFISAFSVAFGANACKYYRVGFSASRMFALAPKMLLDAELQTWQRLQLRPLIAHANVATVLWHAPI